MEYKQKSFLLCIVKVLMSLSTFFDGNSLFWECFSEMQWDRKLIDELYLWKNKYIKHFKILNKSRMIIFSTFNSFYWFIYLFSMVIYTI